MVPTQQQPKTGKELLNGLEACFKILDKGGITIEKCFALFEKHTGIQIIKRMQEKAEDLAYELYDDYRNSINNGEIDYEYATSKLKNEYIGCLNVEAQIEALLGELEINEDIFHSIMELDTDICIYIENLACEYLKVYFEDNN